MLLDILMGIGSGGTLTLSGETIVAGATGPADATATLRIGTDGTVSKGVNGVFTQIDSATDWIIPNSAAPDDYEVRYTNLVGDPIAGPAAVNVWFALSGGNADYVLNTTGATGQSATFTIEIRKGSSGAAIASASYTLQTNII